jgi:hypothetical protein
MSKEITWASSTWLLLHSLTIKMNNNLFLKEKNNILSLFYDICTNLPCPTCSAHAKHVMKEYNFMKISNINQLKDFMFNFHNHVNKNIGKKIEDESVLEKYNNVRFHLVVHNFIRLYPKSFDPGLNLTISSQLHRRKITNRLINWLKQNLKR